MDSNEYARNPKIIDGILKVLNKKHEKHPKEELYTSNEVVSEHLLVGDYKYNGVLVEHKTLPNFFGDVNSGHIFQQAQDMLYSKEDAKKSGIDVYPYILISGDITDIFEQPFGHYTAEPMIAAWASLNRMGIPTSFVGNQWFFIRGIIDLFVKHYDGKERVYNPVRKPIELEHVVLSNYCSISWFGENPKTHKQFMDGIGEKTARRLAEKFRAPKDLYNATAEQLMEVDGIGKSTAEKMVAFFEGRV